VAGPPSPRSGGRPSLLKIRRLALSPEDPAASPPSPSSGGRHPIFFLPDDDIWR
jgi:hypothetical protein